MQSNPMIEFSVPFRLSLREHDVPVPRFPKVGPVRLALLSRWFLGPYGDKSHAILFLVLLSLGAQWQRRRGRGEKIVRCLLPLLWLVAPRPRFQLEICPGSISPPSVRPCRTDRNGHNAPATMFQAKARESRCDEQSQRGSCPSEERLPSHRRDTLCRGGLVRRL